MAAPWENDVAERDDGSWCPFRPTPQDLAQIEADVSEVPDLQRRMVERNPELQLPDRIAHQYQLAASRVVLRIAAELPAELGGVGLFEPGTEHLGIGRISTGQAAPHPQTEPDFLGIMLAFQTRSGRRVDFLAINDPTSPVDDHLQFMDLLHATGEAAGARNFLFEQVQFAAALAARRGAIHAGLTVAHIGGQTLRTARSSTAYQTYWTGIVEVGPTAGKLALVPAGDGAPHPDVARGPDHLSQEWVLRQAAGDVELHLEWIPFVDEKETSTERLTKAWEEADRQRVGTVVFPRADLASEEQRLWAVLASEMGANPGNWVHDRDDSIPQPATRFEVARKIAYGICQNGRNALAPESYREIFETGRIGEALAQELRRRRDEKERAGHVNRAPL